MRNKSKQKRLTESHKHRKKHTKYWNKKNGDMSQPNAECSNVCNLYWLQFYSGDDFEQCYRKVVVNVLYGRNSDWMVPRLSPTELWWIYNAMLDPMCNNAFNHFNCALKISSCNKRIHHGNNLMTKTNTTIYWFSHLVCSLYDLQYMRKVKM